MTTILPQGIFEQQVALRRDLHQHPELSWKEERTAGQIEAALRALGLEPRRMVGTGLVVDLPGADRQDGPVVALRADTDALPVAEETGLSFASQTPGCMHACGHDGHTAILLGAAALLKGAPATGPVRLIWQPAEEQGDGAPRMMDEGVLDGVGAIFGGHLDPRYDPGVLVVTDGAVGASTDEFVITVRGRQGHGARPHEACDAVLAASAVVQALQSIVAREIDPAHAAVVTIGSFHAGTAPNVIAERARLEGTVRSLNPDVRAHLVAAVERVATNVAQAHGASVEIEPLPGTPPVVNDRAMTELAREAALAVVGAERLTSLERANMGGEDFACYLEQVPGSYIRFGGKPASGSNPAHSSRFDFDETALAYGAAWMAEVARRASASLG